MTISSVFRITPGVVTKNRHRGRTISFRLFESTDFGSNTTFVVPMTPSASSHATAWATSKTPERQDVTASEA